MGEKRFTVKYTVTVVIDVDDQVIDAVDDEWRSYFYNLYDNEDIAEMLARCAAKGQSLSQIDGWADQPNKNLELLHEEWELVEVDEWDR